MFSSHLPKRPVPVDSGFQLICVFTIIFSRTAVVRMNQLLSGIVEHRLVSTPAVGVGMHVLLDPERLALLLEHHAEVDVERGASAGRLSS